MYWANFLHIYQPAEQQPDILESVVASCYRPLLSGILAHSRARMTLNINGALLELFDKHGYHDLIDILREAGKQGMIEFTSSAKYHAFLPLLEEQEIYRQITINNETNAYYLGDAWKPRGFFPPEMGYTPSLAHILDDLGFAWVIIDEIACHGTVESVDYTKIHRIKGTNLRVFFRQRRISNLIMSAVVRRPETLKKAIAEDIESRGYAVTAMDGETFGHHRPGLENLLFEIFSDSSFNLVTISQLPEYYREEKEVEPIASTWASSERDLQKGIQFLSWKDPENPIHAWQWELTSLALANVRACEQKKHPEAELLRGRMDIALASDHFWWASAKPWWSVEMIEDGAWRLLSIIKSIPHIDPNTLSRAKELYELIVSTAFQWQRSGKIREMAKHYQSVQRIPFKERTLEEGGEEQGVYHAFIDMMKRLEKESANREEYEQAILWRDARYKIEHKLDIYDALNAIDLLRTKLPHDEIERTIEAYKSRYRAMRGGQPEQRE